MTSEPADLVAELNAKTGTPRIAVIVPAYGVAHLVGEALASLQAQTMPDWECVVIDDGAPDDVAGAVKPFLNDPRIRLITSENQGVSGARNTAIAASSAPYIALLDGDDLFRPHYLEQMLAVIENTPDARLVTCNAIIFGAIPRPRLAFLSDQINGRATGPLAYGNLAEVLDRSFGVYIGTTFRRADFERIGGFDTEMTHAEDLDLWVRLMLLGGKAVHVNQILGDYRIRPSSASASAERMQLGNIRVYEKALPHLAGRSEEAIAKQLIAQNRSLLAFEHAIDRIIDGDTAGGIAELKASGVETRKLWSLLLRLWAIFPALARPMLQWRRMAHTRGNTKSFASFVKVLTKWPQPGRDSAPAESAAQQSPNQNQEQDQDQDQGNANKATGANVLPAEGHSQ